MKSMKCRAAIIVATVLPWAVASAPAQDDSAVLGAIVVYLDETRRDHASMEELWIRDGVFDVSRHHIKRPFESVLRSSGNPVRGGVRT